MTATWLALLALSTGCHRGPSAGPPKTSVDPTGTSDSGPQAATGATGDTAATDTDTGPPTGGICPPYAGLEPSVVLQSPGFGALHYPLAVREDGRGILLMVVEIADLPSNVTVRVDDLNNGAHAFEDLWDGVSTMPEDWEPNYLRPVSDQNDDGIEDYWVGTSLVAGPLLGGNTEDNEVIGTLDEFDGLVYAVDFDADNDGIGDILQTGIGSCAYIRYGPFQGQLPSVHLGEAEPGSYTQLGVCSDDTLLPAAWILPDHYDGRDGVLFGIAGSIADSYAYVLEHQRGARIPTSAAKAKYSVATIEKQPNWADLGDVDGDGQRDYLFGHNNDLQAAKGPLEFDYYMEGRDSEPGAPTRLFELTDDQKINGAVGDLNGDGITDLATIQNTDVDPEVWGSGTSWNVIAFSPFDDPVLDLSCGVPLSYLGEDLNPKRRIGETVVDLDGDGLPDIVTQRQGATDDILIWWGRDIVDAHAALLP